MSNFLSRFARAVSYITCIPLMQPGTNVDEESLEGLAKYLPAVGLLIGLIIATLSGALHCIHANRLLAAALVVSAWLWLTGGLHMDGFMDTADGVYSHRSRERMLEIMQDSRVGNFAVLAAITLLALKMFALAALPNTQACAALLIVPGWARACEVYAIGRFQYARTFGKGKVWHDSIKYPFDLVASSIPVILLTLLAASFNARAALIAAAATIIGGVLVAHWLNEKLQGHTGDTYGAVVEAAEAAGIILLGLSFQL